MFKKVKSQSTSVFGKDFGSIFIGDVYVHSKKKDTRANVEKENVPSFSKVNVGKS